MKKKGRSMTSPSDRDKSESSGSAKDAQHASAGNRSAAGKLAGLKQNLLAERTELEEKMQQLQRRLQAINILLEE